MSEEKDNNVCNRLRAELKRLRMGYADVAGSCDVAEKTVGRWCSSIPIPSDKLGLLAGKGVDVLYVLTGVQSTNLSKVAEGSAKSDQSRGGECVSQEEKGILEMYRELRPADRAHARAVIGAFASKDVKKGETGS